MPTPLRGHDARGQRGSSTPSPIAAAASRIAPPNTTSARPVPRCVATTRPARASAPARERLAHHRHRVRVAVELAGVAVGEELVAVVDDEQRRVAGDLGGAVGGVVDRHDERLGREPGVGHRLALGRRQERRGAHDDVRAVDGVPRRRSHRRGRHAGRPAGDPRRARPPGRDRCRRSRAPRRRGRGRGRGRGCRPARPRR